MKLKRFHLISLFFFVSIFILGGCEVPESPGGTVAPPNDIEIFEEERYAKDIPLTKIFDQCDSSSPFEASYSYGESITTGESKELEISAKVTGGFEIPASAKAEIEAGIRSKFAEDVRLSQTKQDTVHIQVSAGKKQAYTIVWSETRVKGTIKFLNKGETEEALYDYRLGQEFVSSTGKDLPCDSVGITETPEVESDPFALRESDIAKSGETILLLEDFQDDENSLYKLEGGGNWGIEDDIYQPGNKVLQIDTILADEVSFARLLQPVPTSFVAEWKVRFSKDGQDDRQFVTYSWLENWRYVIQPSLGHVYSYNKITGEGGFEHKFNFSTNTWYTLRVIAYGNAAEFYFNNQKVGDISNLDSVPVNDFMSFTIGEGSDTVQFDDFYVITSSQ